MDVTLFGKKAFANVVKMRSLGCGPSSTMTDLLIKRGKFEHGCTQRGEWYVKTEKQRKLEAEIGLLPVRIVWGYCPKEEGTSKEGSSSRGTGECMALPVARFQTSRLYN